MPLPYGELLTDKRHRRSDLRLIEQAVRGGWVPADRRDEIVRQVAAVLDDDPTPRERIAVARVTTAMRAAGDHAEAGLP